MANCYKYEKSTEGFPASFQIFEPPAVDTSSFRKEWISFRPANLTKNSPISFSIPGSSSCYKDLGKMQIFMKVRILKDGAPITAKNEVAFTNLTLQSIMKQVDLTLEQKTVNTSVGLNYAYKAYLDTLLQHPREESLES